MCGRLSRGVALEHISFDSSCHITTNTMRRALTSEEAVGLILTAPPDAPAAAIPWKEYKPAQPCWDDVSGPDKCLVSWIGSGGW